MAGACKRQSLSQAAHPADEARRARIRDTSAPRRQTRLLAAGAIHVIKMEVAPRWLSQQNTSVKELFELLEGHGFELTDSSGKAPHAGTIRNLDANFSPFNIVDYIARLKMPAASKAPTARRLLSLDTGTRRSNGMVGRDTFDFEEMVFYTKPNGEQVVGQIVEVHPPPYDGIYTILAEGTEQVCEAKELAEPLEENVRNPAPVSYELPPRLFEPGPFFTGKGDSVH